jgi:hypothetical protein
MGRGAGKANSKLTSGAYLACVRSPTTMTAIITAGPVASAVGDVV